MPMCISKVIIHSFIPYVLGVIVGDVMLTSSLPTLICRSMSVVAGSANIS